MAHRYDGIMAGIFPALLTVLFLPDVSAQSVRSPFFLETRLNAGINLPFYDAVSFMMEDEIFAFDILAGLPSKENSYWERLYNYPASGAGFSYWTLGNDDVFGRAYALYSFIGVPFLKSRDIFSVSCQVSAGFSNITKRFDVHNNYLNRAIGSHGNIYIRLGIDGKLKISQKCKLVFEAGTSHFSNGKNKSPNRGLNFASVSAGINYRISGNSEITEQPEIPAYTGRLFQSVALSAGTKVYDNLLNKRYLVTSIYYNAERSLDLRNRLGLGAALFYDGSIDEALAEEEGSTENEFTDLIRFGLHGTYSLRYKQIILGIQAGYYLYSNYTDNTRIYSRFSLQYLINERIGALTGIKTHFGKADFLEFGIIYYL